MDQIKIGEFLKELRKQKKLTQQENKRRKRPTKQIQNN